MKVLLLAAVRIYWMLWPARYRRPCVYAVSCSRHVYAVTRAAGLYAGVAALRCRWRTCRPGYRPVMGIDGRLGIRLDNGYVLLPEEIASGILAAVSKSAKEIKEQLDTNERRLSN
jgi:uncharacterized protein